MPRTAAKLEIKMLPPTGRPDPARLHLLIPVIEPQLRALQEAAQATLPARAPAPHIDAAPPSLN